MSWRVCEAGEREEMARTAGLLDAVRGWTGRGAVRAVTEDMMQLMIQQCANAALSEFLWSVIPARSRWTGALFAGTFLLQEWNTEREDTNGRLIFHVHFTESAKKNGLYTCDCKCERKVNGASSYGMVSTSGLIEFERLHDWLEPYLVRILGYIRNNAQWREALSEHMRAPPSLAEAEPR